MTIPTPLRLLQMMQMDMKFACLKEVTNCLSTNKNGMK